MSSKNNTVTEKKHKNRKKLKYGSIATAITVVFIAAVVLLNIIVKAVSNQYNLKLDLTSAKLYEISDSTLDYMKNLNQDVEIACTYKESEMQTNENMKMVYEVLEKYKQSSDHVKLVFFDTTEDPDILQKYQADYSGTINAGDIIIKSGSQVRTVKTSEMFDVDQNKLQYYYYGQVSYKDCITGFSGEQKLTSAIMYVTDADPKKVAFITQSNGENIFNQQNAYSVQALQQLYENNGYDVVNVDITSDDISADTYDVAVLPAPQNDLTEDGIKKLTDFLYNNGDYSKQLMYFADYTQSATPNINEFLELWGIQVDDCIVRESDSSKNQQATISLGTAAFPVASIVEAGDDETSYSEGISNTSLPIITPLSKSIKLLWDSNNERSTQALLKTDDTCYEYPLSALKKSSDSSEESSEAENETEFDENSAEKGEQVIMAAGRRSTAMGEVINTSTVFVAGSMSLVDMYLTQSSSYNNGSYVMNAINVATGKGGGLTIESKDMTAKTITISQGQASLVRNIVVIFIPVIVIAIGVVVFIRRRRK